MPVAKHLSYARSQSRAERTRRIDGPSFADISIYHDKAARARPQRASSLPPAIAAALVAFRSILRSGTQFAETAGETLSTMAAWLLSELLAGCAAYALAMYGLPAAINDKERGDASASTPSDSSGDSQRATVKLISLDIRTDKTLSATDAAQPCASAQRAAQTPDARSSWRAAIIAPAVLLLRKIREGSARRRMIAELRNLDDRSLRDMGISRTDIGYIARYGVRPE